MPDVDEKNALKEKLIAIREEQAKARDQHQKDTPEYMLHKRLKSIAARGVLDANDNPELAGKILQLCEAIKEANEVAKSKHMVTASKQYEQHCKEFSKKSKSVSSPDYHKKFVDNYYLTTGHLMLYALEMFKTSKGTQQNTKIKESIATQLSTLTDYTKAMSGSIKKIDAPSTLNLAKKTQSLQAKVNRKLQSAKQLLSSAGNTLTNCVLNLSIVATNIIIALMGGTLGTGAANQGFSGFSSSRNAGRGRNGPPPLNVKQVEEAVVSGDIPKMIEACATNGKLPILVGLALEKLKDLHPVTSPGQEAATGLAAGKTSTEKRNESEPENTNRSGPQR